MAKLSRENVIKFIEPNIEEFHRRRLENLLQLELKKIFPEKTPTFSELRIRIPLRTLLKQFLMRTYHPRKKVFSGDSLKNWLFLYAVLYMEEKSRLLKELTSNLKKMECPIWFPSNPGLIGEIAVKLQE